MKSKEETLALLIFIIQLATQVMCISKSDCEVCVTVVEKFEKRLTPQMKKDTNLIEEEFKKFCKNTKGKDNRFCYYIGGLEDSATRTLKDLSTPLSWSMPPEKICEKLNKKDAQICDLHYPKKIDLRGVDLKQLKVRELKKVLRDWDEECEACIEKSDFVRRIQELMPRYEKEDL